MEERKGFGSNFGFLMAAVGSAVGLGNIWGFPYKMGANGGFTFLMVYIFLGVTTGFIVMISELAIGRKTGKGAVEAYRMVSKKFKWMGWMGIASAFFILFFYCALGGYCIKYVVVNVGDLFGASFGSAAFAAAHAVTDHEHALLRESGVLVVFAPKTHVTGHRDTDGACGHDAFPFLRVRLTCVVCGFAACPFDSIATLFRESRVRILLKRGKEASIALRNWSTPVQYVVAWPDSMSCPENVA